MRWIVPAVVAGTWLLAGCTGGGNSDVSQNDPYESANRSSYASHQVLYRNVIRPVATFYNHALPQPARTGIHNFLVNADLPVTFGNDLLQASFLGGTQTVARFAVNTTLGIGGFIDIAKRIGIPEHKTDFADTLADYGVPSGPYLYIPVLGPAVPRELAGKVIDSAFDPLTYVTYGASIFVDAGRAGATYVDKRARGVATVDAIERTSADPYATTRLLYERHIEASTDSAPDFDDDPDQAKLVVQETQPDSGAGSAPVAETTGSYCSTVADQRAADAAANGREADIQHAVRDGAYSNCIASRAANELPAPSTQLVVLAQ